jgi:hypothetical protein
MTVVRPVGRSAPCGCGSGITQLLRDEARDDGPNREIVEEWVSRYNRYLEDYAKFAADANRDIGGAPLYRQYF